MLSYRELYDKGMERIREANALDMLDLGAETRSQNRLNREYLESLTLEMRLLGSVPADTGAKIFGREVPCPIQVAAISEGRLMNRLAGHWDEPHLEAVAQGVAEAGSWLWVGAVDPPRLERLIETGVPVVRIVKPLANKGYDENREILHALKSAEDRGAVAVGMDIDVFYGEKTGDEDPYRYSLGPKSLEEMRRFVEATKLPFIVKGVLSVADALKCKEMGARGIVVSHHGGEALDYAVPVLRILPHIRKAVPDLTIFAESGFRRGTDVLKALALGADGVCLLTIVLIAYAGHGKRGVADMLRVLAEELRRNMSLCGCPTVGDIDPSILWQPYPDSRRGE